MTMLVCDTLRLMNLRAADSQITFGHSAPHIVCV